MRVYGQRYQGKTELVRKRKKWYRQSAIALFLLYAFFLMVKAGTGRETLAKRFFLSMTRQYIPTVAYMAEGRQEQTLSDFLLEKVTDQIPLIGYADTIRTYETTIESSLSEEEIVALEGKDEAEVEARQMAEAASRENQKWSRKMRRQEQMRQQKRQSSRKPRIIQQSTLSRWWRFQEKN